MASGNVEIMVKLLGAKVTWRGQTTNPTNGKITDLIQVVSQDDEGKMATAEIRGVPAVIKGINKDEILNIDLRCNAYADKIYAYIDKVVRVNQTKAAEKKAA